MEIAAVPATPDRLFLSFEHKVCLYIGSKGRVPFFMLSFSYGNLFKYNSYCFKTLFPGCFGK